VNRSFRVPAGSGFGPALGGRAPADLVALLAVVFTTYAMQFFASSAAAVGLLRLDAAAWQGWQLWRLATYALAGYGPASVWILLELLVLYWFSRDLRTGLGARRFWSLLAAAALAAGLVAVAVDAAATLAGGQPALVPYSLMQGQRALLAVAIAAFASRNAEAVIYLFFVLPVRAGAFVWVSVAIAFVGFLASKDLAGLAGLWTATAMGFLRARPRGGRPPLRRALLRWREAWLRWKLDRLRRRSRLRVVDGGRGPDRGGDTIN
jgi:membrane associated rhomboid family serine protease